MCSYILGRYVCQLEMVVSIASRPLSTSPGVEKILQNNLKPRNACKIIDEIRNAKEKFV